MTYNKNIQLPITFLLFTGLGYVALHIPLTHLLGTNTKLTVFDAFAPIAGGLFWLPTALLSLLAIQSTAITSITTASVIKLMTPLAAAFYFSNLKPNDWIASLVLPQAGFARNDKHNDGENNS